MSEILFQLEHITKEFPGVLALNDVSLDIQRGEVLALVGENGAGKSTLIKLMTGALTDWQGEMLFEGKPIRIAHPYEAQKLGIATIYQELTLCSNVTVADNIYLGREPKKKNGLIDWKKLYRDATDILAELGVHIPPTTEVSRLSVATQQLVEIARALTMKAKLIIMDEPTSSLSKGEVEILYGIVKRLKERGISILYISHKFDEVFALSDRISILRDGCHIATVNTAESNVDDIIKMMVGREITTMWPNRAYEKGEQVFAVRNLTRKGTFENIGWDLHKGEILGIYGLVGAGRTEMARAVCGIDSADSGEICVDGKWQALPKSAGDAITKGIVMLPEDRKEEGLLLRMSVAANISMSKMLEKSQPLVVNAKQERQYVDSFIDSLHIRTPSRNQLVNNLSGGNQQKVVVAKLMNTQSHILIFDEPTRGIDVGAKSEIYDLMNQLTEQGYSIVMISSELPEIVGMSDRVIVMFEGKIMAILNKEEANAESIVTLATSS